ncbi:rhomboid family intramembrane serine protease [Luteibaculum oceani]|uniref:Rhomboid family intramembrane serine protease n=1 Tax=Luteibaculum oceani TaxID=1294296 RepID=A0A5C6UU94_9FLAO|nr:rhomboid family intramembrane serine protease [Luteibaculum oceani]TXC76933.1 rhomboid family intramembrane serine protease [Luteibaculum oceani]
MAVGFPAKFQEEFPLPSQDKVQLGASILTAAEQLNWELFSLTENSFTFVSRMSWTSWGEKITISILEDEISIISCCAGVQIVDFGKNKENVARLRKELDNALLSPDEGAIVRYHNLLNSLEDAAEQQEIDANPLIPNKVFLITPLLIWINVAIFLVMVIGGGIHAITPDPGELIAWGANFKPLVFEGEYWRVLSSNYLHIGVIHLIVNLFALLQIGVFLEPLIGKTKFFVAYTIAGIFGSIISLYWNAPVVAAGASGAIFGMYGLFIALLLTRLIPKKTRSALLTSMVIFVAYNLLNGLNPGIDNAAHIGGLIAGLVLGFCFYPTLKKPNDVSQKIVAYAISLSLLFVVSAFALKNTTNELSVYQKNIEEFAYHEEQALIFMNDPNQGKETIHAFVANIDYVAIYHFKQAKTALLKNNQLELNDFQKERNSILLDYCNLRIESLELLKRALKEDTDKYDPAIERTMDKIEEIISTLTNS